MSFDYTSFRRQRVVNKSAGEQVLTGCLIAIVYGLALALILATMFTIAFGVTYAVWNWALVPAFGWPAMNAFQAFAIGVGIVALRALFRGGPPSDHQTR